MSEAIARMIGDLRTGRAQIVGGRNQEADDIIDCILRSPVIDATALRRQLDDRGDRLFDIEEDFVVAPPLPELVVAFEEDGPDDEPCVSLLSMLSHDLTDGTPSDAYGGALHGDIPDGARWITAITLWQRGYSATEGETVVIEHIPTLGPMYGWRLAIDATGRSIDTRYADFTRPITDKGVMAFHHPIVVALSALNFLNTRNVEMAEPTRNRATRRRIERAVPGLKIHELVVFPVGRRRRPADRPEPLFTMDSPLHQVRGHFVEYGINGKGLLFGKLAGRWWVPAHMRGSAKHGTVRTDYRLETS